MKKFGTAEILEMDKDFRRVFINSLSGFKSAQLLGTLNADKQSNLAIFNSIFHVGAHPPYIGLVIRPDGNHHETMANILTQQCYSLNNVLTDNFVNAHQTSARYHTGQSEFKECGFEEEYIENFNAPFVKESNIKIGIKLKEVIPVHFNKTKILIGEIVHIIIDESLVSEDGFVNLHKAKSATVAGLDAYYETNLLGRLSYAKPDKKPSCIDI